ncbi:MAG: glycine cleavage T C-terminal barrel domain-containing protein [Alphaproteobacteria bacterium]
MSKDHNGYFGAGVLNPAKNATPERARVGIKITGSGIAREGAPILANGQPIGTLTSGGFSPSLKVAIGQGYVKSEFAQVGREVEVEVRGRKIPAVIHDISFVPAKTKNSSMKKAS